MTHIKYPADNRESLEEVEHFIELLGDALSKRNIPYMIAVVSHVENNEYITAAFSNAANYPGTPPFKLLTTLAEDSNDFYEVEDWRDAKKTK